LIDGLFDLQLKEMLREAGNAAEKMVETAVKNSGRDNTTALVVQVV
jgi:serine/threonine protein phosphatase PrpC